MDTQLHISASCIITGCTVYKNGKGLFTSDKVNMPEFLIEVYKHFELSYNRFYKMDSLSKLGWLASEILLTGTFNEKTYQPHQVSIVLSNANASLDSDQKYMASVADIPSPALFVYTLPNIVIGEICIRNSFKGETAFFVSENFDEDFIEQYVTNLFNNNSCQACICGWVDVAGNNYKAVLFLIEKGEGDIPFTVAHINNEF